MPITSLKSAKLIVNVSDIEEPLKFSIEGDKMVPTLYMVMIVELRKKTKEEIKNESETNKDYERKFFRSNLEYSPFKANDLSFKFVQKQYLNYYKVNLDDLPRDKSGHIIWPLDNATEMPVYERAIIQGVWKAEFSMRDYSWLDTRNYIYGVLGSNDQVTFTGENAEEEKSIELDIEILEGEQFVNFYIFQNIEIWIWIIPFFAAGMACLIGFIIVILLLRRYRNNKIEKDLADKNRKNKKRRK